jgi:hypothetical protein
MAITETTPVLDQDTADKLSAAYHRCFETFEAEDDLFTPDAFFDMLPPYWRFQLEGADAFVAQLEAIAAGTAEVEIIRTVPTVSGFVTEHKETHHTPDGEVIARRLHLCEVRDGRIAEVSIFCNGGWDGELRARHAAEAPMLRP